MVSRAEYNAQHAKIKTGAEAPILIIGGACASGESPLRSLCRS